MFALKRPSRWTQFQTSNDDDDDDDDEMQAYIDSTDMIIFDELFSNTGDRYDPAPHAKLRATSNGGYSWHASKYERRK